MDILGGVERAVGGLMGGGDSGNGADFLSELMKAIAGGDQGGQGQGGGSDIGSIVKDVAPLALAFL